MTETSYPSVSFPNYLTSTVKSRTVKVYKIELVKETEFKI